MEKVYSGLSKVYGEVVVGSIQSVWRRCSLVYPKCMENALVLPCTKGRDGRPGMHESTPAEECVRSKSWSVPAHVSIGYIIRGLADAPSPEGEGPRESAQPQGVDDGFQVQGGGWRWAPWDLIGEQWGSHSICGLTGPQVSVYSSSMPEVRADMRKGVNRAPFSDLFRLNDFRLQRHSDLFLGLATDL